MIEARQQPIITAAGGRLDRLASPRSKARTSLWLFASCLVTYELTTYGGVRSPDSEVVFRTSLALATSGSFAVERGLEDWPGFGTARGRDDRSYSIFGPGEAMVAVPLVQLGTWMADAGYFRRSKFPLPVSHYVPRGLAQFVEGRPVTDRDAHGIRLVAAQLNVLLTALTVVLTYFVAFLVSRKQESALLSALIYAFGTLAWPYSGTFFSEPLAILFVTASLYLLLRDDPTFGGTGDATLSVACSGALLGAATLTHISAVLFAPFFAAYAVLQRKDRGSVRDALASGAAFAGALGLVLAILASYNYFRFGDPLQTGRSVDPRAAAVFGYGAFVSPLRGLYGLLVGSNKGIVLFCPAVLVAAAGWRALHRLQPVFSWTMLAAIASRLLFIASRSDWHGGYALGPRLLLLLLPLAAPAIALWSRDLKRAAKRHRQIAVMAVWACMCQQLYFSLGEIFSHYHLRNWAALRVGENIFAADRMYLQWRDTPLLTLLDGNLGPYVLRQLGTNAYVLLGVGCGLLATMVAVLWRCFSARRPSASTRADTSIGAAHSSAAPDHAPKARGISLFQTAGRQ